MCVGVPSRILAITDGPMPMARIDVAGQASDICLAYVPEARVGDYVLVAGGFAMSVLDETAAAESLATWAELGMIDLPLVSDAAGPDAVAPDVRPG